MSKLFWFCPENDIALAKNCRRFTAPRQAALLATHGAPLMWWMGTPDDFVLIPQHLSPEETERLAEWENDMISRFGAGPAFVDSLAGLSPDVLLPWGWSTYVEQALLNRGLESNLLNRGMGNADELRMLSHRRSATVINERLGDAVDFSRYGVAAPRGASEAKSVEDVVGFAREHGGFYIKSPWSSSGRGVVASGSAPFDVLLERCSGIIATQGSVMLEPAYDKDSDFAMLFSSDGEGRVTFHGLSWFATAGNAYTGNLLISDAEILEKIAAKLPVPLIEDVKVALESVLSELVGSSYRGFLGIDMMIVRERDGKFGLVPCVEMNLRMTMGVVAHHLRSRLGDGFAGRVMQTLPASRAGAMAVDLVPPNPFFAIGIR